MPANKNVAFTTEYANSIHAKRLSVFPGLVLTCFLRDSTVTARGPLFVVREIDVKIIRNKHAGINKPTMHSSAATPASTAQVSTGQTGKSGSSTSFLTEQAIRASVRQAVLNMNLALEPASKQEIQYLKHIGILGKRAPSCSLLDGNDMALLLEAFGRTYASTELRNAMHSIISTQSYATLLPPTINSSDGDEYHVGAVQNATTMQLEADAAADSSSSGPLPQLKRQIVRKRKLQRLLSDNSKPASTHPPRHRQRTASEPCIDARDGCSADEVSDNLSTGSNSSNGLDCLLSALSSPSSTAATVTVASTPSQSNVTSSMLQTHQPAMHSAQPYAAVVYPHTMFNPASFSQKLALSASIPPLPAQLPSFPGIAQYSTLSAPARVLAQRNGHADHIVHSAANNTPLPAQAVYEPAVNKVQQVAAIDTSVVADCDSVSPTPSDSYDGISTQDRHHYMANMQSRLRPEIAI